MELARAERTLRAAKLPQWHPGMESAPELTRNIPLEKLVARILAMQSSEAVLELGVVGEAGELTLEVTARLAKARTELRRLSVAGWRHVHSATLRPLILSSGHCIQEIDASSSGCRDDLVQMIAVRAEKLRTIDLSLCPNITLASLRAISAAANATLVSLSLARNEQIADDGIAYLAGTIGHGNPSCHRLQSLDLSKCTLIGDEALISLGKGCRKLRYLSLDGCDAITDRGVVALARGCAMLRVLNLHDCKKLTSKSVVAVGRNCSNLRSLHVGHCTKVTDVGLLALGEGCAQLQSVQLSGCWRVTEGGVCALAQSCAGLQLMNLTGCELISTNGLTHLLRGLPFVEAAVSFFGFKPRADSVALKFGRQQRIIHDASAMRIQGLGRGWRDRRMIAQRRRFERETNAATLLGNCTRRRFAKLELQHRQNVATKRLAATRMLQRVRRGQLGKRHFTDVKWLRKVSATERVMRDTQRIYRGVRVRRSKLGIAVRRRVGALASQRQREADAAVGARFERSIDRIVRKFNGRFILARQRVIKEERIRAAKFLQHYTRDAKGRKLRKAARAAMARLAARKAKAATDVQRCYRGHQGYRRARKTRYRRERAQIKRLRAARMLQRAHRGRAGRLMANELRRDLLVRMNAAKRLQAVFRGTRTESLQSMLRKALKDRVRLKARTQAGLSRHHAGAAEQKRLDDLDKDSASEDSDMLDAFGDVLPELDDGYVDPGDDWTGPREDNAGLTFWFSPSRNEKRFQVQKPPRPHAFERALVGCTVKIYWPLEEQWFTGELQKFNPRHSDAGNGRHKVVYEDGDHEWLELKLEVDRIQLFDQKNQVWLSFQIVINEEHARARKEKKAIALAKQYAEVGEFFEALYAPPAGDYRDAPIETPDALYAPLEKASGAAVAGGYGEDAFAAAMEPVGTVQGSWEMIDSGSGVYWYNHQTEESSWERPADFPVFAG